METVLSVIWFILFVVVGVVVIESDEQTTRGISGGLFLIISLVGLLWFGVTLTKDTYKLLSDCQQHLPRSEKCVLIAIPEQLEE
jgi:hypothetical protein